MRRLTTATSAAGAAATNSMPHRSSRSTPTRARWDFDSTQKLVLADIDLAGRRRQVVMQASKNGFYYVLDRGSGELLSAHNFAFVSWTRGIDPKTGRPIVDPSADFDHGQALVFPSVSGAHSWQPMAFDAAHGVTFIPVIEEGKVIVAKTERPAGLG